jgi:hypothetical protein
MGIVSENTLFELYQFYNNLKFFGNYSLLEIDSMYPFERPIFMGLLNKTIDEKNKQRQ